VRMTLAHILTPSEERHGPCEVPVVRNSLCTVFDVYPDWWTDDPPPPPPPKPVPPTVEDLRSKRIQALVEALDGPALSKPGSKRTAAIDRLRDLHHELGEKYMYADRPPVLLWADVPSAYRDESCACRSDQCAATVQALSLHPVVIGGEIMALGHVRRCRLRKVRDGACCGGHARTVEHAGVMRWSDKLAQLREAVKATCDERT
jgi:hypothetical protein